MDLYQRQVEVLLRGIAWDEGGLAVAAPDKLYGVMPGDKVKVTASLQYKGPKLDDYFYAAIGEWRGITWPADIGLFDEIWQNSVGFSWAAASDWTDKTLSVEVPITEIGLFPWTPGWFDLYAKIGIGLIPRVISSRLDDVIEVLLKPQFRNFAIESYDRIAG